ncbi:MAG: DUF6119 family protein, partial [Anaerolineales bacterium]
LLLDEQQSLVTALSGGHESVVKPSEDLDGWGDSIVATAKSLPVEPGWHKEVRQLADIPVVKTKTVRAAIILRIKSVGTFALTFGPAGHHLLEQRWVKRGWGRVIALNELYDDHGKPVDQGQVLRRGRRSTMGVGITTDVASSEPVVFEQFGFEPAQDILRSVTVASKSGPRIGAYVTGEDGVQLTWKEGLTQLPSLCRELEAKYQSMNYKTHFSFVDDLAVVTDSDSKDKVWEAVVDHIRDGRRHQGSIGIILPRGVDIDLAGAKVSLLGVKGNRRSGGHILTTVDLGGYRGALRQLGILGSLTASDTKSHTLRIHANDGEKRPDVPFRACLEGTVSVDGMRYVVLDKAIYEVRDSFVDALDRYIDAIPQHGAALLRLPKFSSAPERLGPKNKMVRHERDYNLEVERKSKLNRRFDRLMLDADNVVTAPGRTSQVEPCDILTNDRHFVHVKRGLAASDMSHLFSQAVVSSELLIDSVGYRMNLRDKIEERCSKMTRARRARFLDAAPENLLSGAGITVVIAIIDARFAPLNANKPLSRQLSFFNKLNLRAAHARLKKRSFDVIVAGIPV